MREKHPVIDFLFEYYRFRPAKLGLWSPGLGVVLNEGLETFGDRRHFREVPEGVEIHVREMGTRSIESTQWILRLLEETQSRPPQFGCHGLHEWAMVYGTDFPRHLDTALRLSPEEIGVVVESQNLTCTHFDAFRFFADPAKPLNRDQLSREDMARREQPGCLHANMDVYRWAMKRYPWVSSDLIADAFLLALEIRQVDMRASPYELSHLDCEPIRIETTEGRVQYREFQVDFHRRALPLRERLITAYRRILSECEELAIEPVDR